ncbi:crossover junction endodeoxyribonuclease RuvC [Candidatus Riesia sp. GBBU]|nr:crossover junction endodeoxyribonuclease RuvC [Candidatus Riesia sp. GBBU]
MKTIIGIDPGSRTTGYGIISQDSKKVSYLNSGSIESSSKPFPTRLQRIYNGISKIIKEYKPDIFVIEQTFFSKNANSVIKLSQAKGVAVLAAVNNRIPIFEYSSKTVKQFVAGSGSAKKTQVQYMVCLILELFFIPKIDESDALAIAITHSYFSQKLKFVDIKKDFF